MKHKTGEKVIEGNKLIAYFDGKTYKPIKAGYENGNSWISKDIEFLSFEEALEFCNQINKHKHPDECFFPLPNAVGFEFKYHTSWDWLMPACKKFIGMSQSKFNYTQFNRFSNLCYRIEKSLITFEIEKVWSVLVEAIEWYNQQTK